MQLCLDISSPHVAKKRRRRPAAPRREEVRQLAFDLVPPSILPRPDPARERRHAGILAYHAGLAAETQVAAAYERRGARVLAHRWRCRYGELDLIVAEGERIVFVEVKRAKRHDWALERITQRQIERIDMAAAIYLDREGHGCRVDTRFDVATVDGIGDIRIMENAFA